MGKFGRASIALKGVDVLARPEPPSYEHLRGHYEVVAHEGELFIILDTCRLLIVSIR